MAGDANQWSDSILGWFMVPLMISSWLYTLPVLFAIILGLVIVVTIAVPRATGDGRRWLALAWKIGAWVLAAGALGLAIESITLAMCDDACRTALRESGRPAPLGSLRAALRGLHRDRAPGRPGRQRSPSPRAEPVRHP